MRRAAAINRPQARSATQSVSTSGVLLTCTPRLRRRHVDGFIAHAPAADGLQVRQGVDQLGIGAEVGRGDDGRDALAVFGQGGLAVGEFPEFDDVAAVGQGLVGGGEPASEPTWMMRGLVVMLSYKWVAKGPCYLIRAQWPGAASGGSWLLVHLGLSRVPWRGARAVSGLANDGRGVDAFHRLFGPASLLNAPGPSVWVIVRGRGVQPYGFPDIQNILILVFQNECGSAGRTGQSAWSE